MLAIVKIYVDLIISGKRTYSSLPEKIKKDALTELKDRVKAGVISESTMKELIKK